MFKDKVVVLTGAGSGIGRELALQFSEAGAQLALSDINQAGLDQTLAMLASKSGATVRGLRKGSKRILTGNKSSSMFWMARLFPNAYPELLRRFF